MSTCTRCVQRLSSSSPRKVAALRALNGMALRVLNSMAARNTKPLPRSILTSEGQGPRDGHGLLEGLVQRPVRVRGRGGLDTMVRGLKQVTRVGTHRNDNRRATLHQRNGRRDGSAFLLGRQTMTMGSQNHPVVRNSAISTASLLTHACKYSKTLFASTRRKDLAEDGSAEGSKSKGRERACS